MNKLVTIESSGPIRAMGGISGPIKTPTSLSTAAIISLINDNMVVYEVNPKNYNEKIRLTRLNINSDNFKTVTKEKIDNNKKVIKKNIQKRVNVAKAMSNNIVTPVIDVKKNINDEKKTMEYHFDVKPKETETATIINTIDSPISNNKNVIANSFVSNKNSRKKKRR